MLGAIAGANPPALRALRTRAADDFTVALMDAWAVALDVLGFYSERIAQEGYVETAAERRSLVELGRLIGHVPRPGVAATAWLAFEVEATGLEDDVEVPARTRVNSVPGPGETMATFETEAALRARPAWNKLRARQERPQTLATVRESGLYVEGSSPGLRRGDPILLGVGGETPTLHRVYEVFPDPERRRTRVVLAGTAAADEPSLPTDKRGLGDLLRDAAGPAGRRPRRSALPTRGGRPDLAAPGRDGALPGRLRAALADPAAAAALGAAWRGWRRADNQLVRAWALRVSAPLFAHNAPLRTVLVQTPAGGQEPPPGPNVRRGRGAAPAAAAVAADRSLTTEVQFREWLLRDDAPPPADAADPALVHRDALRLDLDGSHPIVPGGWVAVEHTPRGGGGPLVAPLGPEPVEEVSVGAFGMTGRSTRLRLAADRPWRDPPGPDDSLTPLRRVRVHAGSEPLALTSLPIEEPVDGAAPVMLDTLVEGLEPGRTVLVVGERRDLLDGTGAPIPGVRGAELAVIAAVTDNRLTEEERELGDTPHSVVAFARPLSYDYARADFAIHANVAPASHGATREKVLGGGDPSVPFQTFSLLPPPLGYVSAPTAEGAASTLELRVDKVLWRAVEAFAGEAPTARVYRVLSGEDEGGAARVVFGDGREGARPPAGATNIAARWRDGVGPAGNARAGTLTLLAEKPLGVKAVDNPLPASGGAGPDDAAALRLRLPIAARALDRLVSPSDYADLALNFAGIDKAQAASLSHRGAALLHVTVAGAGDQWLDPEGRLLADLAVALRRFGDPELRVEVAPRSRLVLVLGARIAVAPERRFEDVAEAARAALLKCFGFDAVGLGQDLFRSAALGALQAVPGVLGAVVGRFEALGEDALAADFTGAGRGGAAPTPEPPERITVEPASARGDLVLPAQLGCLSPDLEGTLVIEEMAP